jgi:hypothetical protein
MHLSNFRTAVLYHFTTVIVLGCSRNREAWRGRAGSRAVSLCEPSDDPPRAGQGGLLRPIKTKLNAAIDLCAGKGTGGH